MRRAFLREATRKKVKFKWHVRVMRSHVTWYFSSRTDVEQMKGAEKEKMGKTLR
jgi:hypothetical protein